jgi:alkylation response protein AidB-like acyl-CoA dehydrogenase
MKSREDILKIARELSDTFATRAADHDTHATFPHENFADFRAAGYPLLPVPEEYGGWGSNLSDAVRAQEIIAQGDGSTALAMTMHLHVVGGEAASPGWRPNTFAALCDQIVQRGALVNSCATEPELGSPLRGGMPKTTARREGNVWIVNGRKSFATLSPELDYFLTNATVADGEPQIGAFLIPRQPAICIEETWDAMGMRSTGSHDLVINDAVVPEDHVLDLRPPPPPGSSGKLSNNAWFALNVSVVYIGVAAAAHRHAVDYARTRVPTALGRPIATLESIQRRLGEAELALQTARSLIYHAADLWDRFPEQRNTMNEQLGMVKIVATNKAIEIVDHAMRVVGGTSMLQDQPLARYYRDVRAGLYHPPTDDATLPLYGRLALERDGDNISE